MLDLRNGAVSERTPQICQGGLEPLTFFIRGPSPPKFTGVCNVLAT